MMHDARGNTIISTEASRPPPAAAAQAAPATAAAAGEPRGEVGPLRWPAFSRLIAGLPEAFVQRLASAWGVKAQASLVSFMAEPLAALAEPSLEPGMLGLAAAPHTGEPALVAMDRRSVFGLLECALGGRPDALADLPPARPYTLVEESLMRPAAEHLLAALRDTLAPAGPLALTFRRWEREPARLAGDLAGAALVLRLTVTLYGVTSTMAVAVPMPALEPLRARLAAADPGADAAFDPRWRRRLADEVRRAPVALTAMLPETMAPLSRIHTLAVGDTLEFDSPADPLVGLYAGSLRLGEGRLGRSGSRVALRLDTPIIGKKEG